MALSSSPTSAVTNWYATASGDAGKGASVVAGAVNDIVQGTLSLPPVAFGAGVQLGMSVIDGVLSVFGESGAAFSRFAHSLTESVGTILQQGAQGIGSILKGILGVAGAGLSIAGVVAGSLPGAAIAAGGVGLMTGGAGLFAGGTMMGIAGMPVVGAATAGAGASAFGAGASMASFGVGGMLIGAAIGGGIMAGIMGVVKHLAEAVSGTLGSVVKIFGEIGKVGTAAVQSILDVLKDVMSTALSQSRSILDLSQQSGLPIGAASQAYTTARAFGVDPSQISTQNAFIQSLTNRVWGISGQQGTLENVASFRARYRSIAGLDDSGQAASPMRLMMAQNMAQMTGMQGYTRAAYLPDATFNRQSEMARGLEMPAASVVKFQQDLQSALDLLSVLGDNVKTTLGTALLPAVMQGLTAVTDYWKSNQAAIVENLFALGRFIYADLPMMVIGGLQAMLGGATTFMHGVAGVMEGIGGFAHSMADFIRAFQAGDATFLDSVGNFLGGVDSLINTIHSLRGSVAGVGAIFYDFFVMIGHTLVFTFNMVGSIINNLMAVVFALPTRLARLFGLDGLAGGMDKFRIPHYTLPYGLENPLDEYMKAAGPTSHLKTAFDDMRSSRAVSNAADALDKAGDALEGSRDGRTRGVADKLNEWTDRQNNAIGGFLTDLAGRFDDVEARRRDYDMLTRLDKIAANTGATAANTAATANNISGLGSNILDQVIDQQAKRAVNGVVSISPSTY